ncbi:alpha/beta hydrolase [Enterococcus bulliens]
MKKKFVTPKPIFSEQSKKAVILFHAYSGSPNDVRMLARKLEQEHYTVYTPMFTGHGTVDPHDILAASPNQWFEEAKAAVTLLVDKGYDQIAVFGLSLGGMYAMRLLEQQIPQIIGGGSFCSPITPVETNVPTSFLWYANMVLDTFTDLSPDEKARELETVPKKVATQLAGIQEHSQMTYDELAKITQPILFVQAAQDEMIPAESVFNTIQQVKDKKFTLNWYPNSGHVVTVGPERKQFEQDVVAFLQTLSWNEE